MSSVIDPDLHRRNVRTVSALAALFLVPLALSFWLYYGLHWRPSGSANHGELITPARPLPQVSLPDAQAAPVSHVFAGKWTLVYVGDGACDAECREALYFMRQTRLSLNNEMTRVQRVFLSTGHCCDRAYLSAAHPGLVVLDASTAAAQPLLAQFPAQARARTLFVVDPLGNLMMRYDDRQPPKGLLEDLKRLLQLSSIG